MIKRFYNYFLAGYSNESLEVQKKVAVLFTICCLFPFTLLLPSFFIFKINTYLIMDLFIIIPIDIFLIIIIKKNKFHIAAFIFSIIMSFQIFFMFLSFENLTAMAALNSTALSFILLLLMATIFTVKFYISILLSIVEIIMLFIMAYVKMPDSDVLHVLTTDLNYILLLLLYIFLSIMCYYLFYFNKGIIKILSKIIDKSKEITVNLNSNSKEIEAASQEQTTAFNEHASAITEVSTTLEELTITAQQITQSVGELVISSEEVIKFLNEIGKNLEDTVILIEDVGDISARNTAKINELGKRSIIINEMVELIKDVANKTNILSINASIEASRNREVGSGFSVVAAEIRELSKETISSAKRVETAAREIQEFLNSIIVSSVSESEKVMGSSKNVKNINSNIDNIINKINNNYTFTQRIDVSIKQQEHGSKQVANTMKQMAEIARQSAESARQTLGAVKEIVNLTIQLDRVTNDYESKEKKVVSPSTPPHGIDVVL